jgi:hypothetical protein
MFYTITEVAKKWKLDIADFDKFVHTNHSSVLLSNPDISASGYDTHLIKSDAAYTIVSDFLTKDVNLPTSDELHTLQKDAITAIATYFAKLNVTSSFDFNMDMRLEGDHEMSPAEFMNDPSCLGDFLSDMEQDIYARTSEIQKEFAKTINK